MNVEERLSSICLNLVVENYSDLFRFLLDWFMLHHVFERIWIFIFIMVLIKVLVDETERRLRLRKFYKKFDSLNVRERKEVCVTLFRYTSGKGFDEPYSWNVVAIELKGKTKLGYLMLKNIKWMK